MLSISIAVALTYSIRQPKTLYRSVRPFFTPFRTHRTHLQVFLTLEYLSSHTGIWESLARAKQELLKARHFFFEIRELIMFYRA